MVSNFERVAAHLRAGASPLHTSFNTKQRERLIKRRVARQKLQEFLLVTQPPKTYLIGRPWPCMRRPRGPDGRFLGAEKIAAQREMETEAGRRTYVENIISPTLYQASTPLKVLLKSKL
ncbi:hypothetical protein C7974DRAFT_397504 [Boeremia exigua]|uniref:uncharacterized protein n=1 Tax=Boeremia exigua TaxID=749465 RepID=UPI001E8E7AF8|nr:uncharacterized protein C7974DRAFT_397504 [Boeremia exigua]KAH6622008.1 hypothetical protein C7974DRAFT_397504 [Boeremia exigua]